MSSEPRKTATVRHEPTGAWRRRDHVLYSVAVTSYVLAGLAWKPMLNWLVGPLWIVVVVGVVPSLVRRAAGRQ